MPALNGTEAPPVRLSRREATLAQRYAAALRARRNERLGRAPHASRDPDLVTAPEVRTALVRQLAAVIDADPGLVAWVEDRLRARHRRPGRPRELAVRTALICYLAQVVVRRNFRLVDLPELLAGLSWRVRRQLGIDYRRGEEATTVSYNQLLDLFHDLADCFDAWSEDLTPDLDGLDPVEVAEAEAEEHRQRNARAQDLQEFVDRLVAASTAAGPQWSGNVAVDATMKWSWERPPGSGGSKLERAGRDGDAGPTKSLVEVVGVDGAVDRDQVFEDLDPAEMTERAAAARTRRTRAWPSTWSHGAAWVGRPNKRKVVHGYAFHSAVRSDPGQPCLIESFTVTAANADPASSLLPVLRRLHDRRADEPATMAAAVNGELRLLGDVAADPGYSGARPHRWHLPLKALGASPVFRLHSQNQEGLRWHMVGRGTRTAQVPLFNGRPVCPCVTRTRLIELRYPGFGASRTELADHATEVARLARYEWAPNGAPRANGSRQWLAPHRGAGPDGQRGGCPHCVHHDGRAVLDEDGNPLERCCTVPSRLISGEVTALDQGVPFGGQAWQQLWWQRSRVEGSYGVLKHPAVVSWSRDFHHFVGLARETLVAAFAAVAYNFHMLRQWHQRQRLTSAPGPADPFAALPSGQVTATVPAPGARLGARDRSRPEPESPPPPPGSDPPRRRRRRPPRGLSMLGPPGPAP